MKLISIQAGMPKRYGEASKKSFLEREWETGFFKEAVSSIAEIVHLGIVGDGQADLKVHGGPDKAICVYPSEHFEYWRSELGFKMQGGAFGENFTTAGADESSVCIGDSYQIDEVIVQVTQPRQPCWKLSRRWKTKELAALVQQSGKTGWYFRVLQEGSIQAPREIRLLERPNEKWTIARCNQVMHRFKNDNGLAAELASLPELSASWRSSLSKRAGGRRADSEDKRLNG